MARARFRFTGRRFRHIVVSTVVICHVALAPGSPLGAQETRPSTTSAVAGDESNEASTQEKKHKVGGASFLPIPIFITEPAVGVGLGVALTYFHKRKEAAESHASLPPAMSPDTPADTVRKRKPPPTITAVVGAYTDSGSWVSGLAHSRSLRGDTIRYSGAAAYTKIKSTIYRYDIPFDFEIDGGMLYQDVRLRLGKSNFFLGGKLSALATEGKIALGSERLIELGEGDTTDVGLAAQVSWETRDNVMTPNHGQLVALTIWRHDDALGSDYDYWSANFKVHSFHELSDRFVLGWRIDAKAVDGKPPFWGYPWVTLRGIPALRYQNERVGLVEVEARYNLARRWGVVGFVGSGSTDGDNPAFETQDRIFAGGVGGRFLFKEDENLWVGIDIARGPEDTHWYIQVGQAW